MSLRRPFVDSVDFRLAKLPDGPGLFSDIKDDGRCQ
jgi:hypothetical protein